MENIFMDQNQFEGTLNEFTGKAESLAGDVTGDAKLKGQGVADQASGKLQQGYARARETVRGVVDDVSTQARQAAGSAQDTMGSVGEVLEANVHERPLLALAAAGALGYVFAFLIHRK
jgi:uncharacterized protein YjbJ (UPF0337 family)